MRYNSNCKRGKQTELTKYLEKADKNIMTNEELLHRITFKEVNEIRKELQDKLEMALFKNNLGIKIAKVQFEDEKLNINQVYNVEFRLTFMQLVGLDANAMQRLAKVLNEMSKEIEAVNSKWKGYTFVF